SWPWSIDRALVLLVFYVAGAMLSDRLRALRRPPSWLLGAVVLAGYGTMLGLAMTNDPVDYVNEWYGHPALFYAAAACGIVATLALAWLLEPVRALSSIGAASLTILVLHKFPVVGLQVLASRWTELAVWQGVLVVLGISVVATLLSWACHRPLVRWMPWSIGVWARSGPRRGAGLRRSVGQ
ncbi:MAG: acyltransferase family protein, partial [Propionibacteriaceae bacterium]|nr:acyltransferase family protein [Propionibacteriaceae bacterium]